MSDYEYKIVPYHVGCTGTLDESDLQNAINKESTNGWRFKRSIQERRRVFLFYTRQEHFLIFERRTGTQAGGQEQAAFSQP